MEETMKLRRVIIALCAISLLFACQNITIDDDGELKAPVYLTANASGTTVNLEWQIASGAISYSVYYKKNATGVSVTDFTDKKEGVLQNTTSITGLDSGYTYAFIVLAVGTGGTKSDPSPVATASISVNLPVPQFNKTAGAYPGTQWVGINNYADFPTGALIAYTTNGTDPNGISPTIQPNGSIEITTSCTRKVLAYVPGWNMSTYSTAEAAYTLVDVHTLCVEESATTIFRNTGNSVHSFSGTLPKVMYYDGTDYYSAGYGVPQNYLLIWKNGNQIASLNTTTTSSIQAITVSGSTVYVAGSLNNNAYYWTCSTGGGDITPNSLSNSGRSCVNAIYPVSGKIYLGGYEKNGTGAKQAYFWVRGSVTAAFPITANDENKDFEVTGIFSVDGTDVIMSGTYFSEGSTYAYAYTWDDADPDHPKIKELTTNPANTVGLAYSASGNIYVGGYEPVNNRSVVWQLTMPIDTSAVTLAHTYATFVLRSMTIDSFGNIFAAGMFNSGGAAFRFYINSTPYTIAATAASQPSIPSIFIKAK